MSYIRPGSDPEWVDHADTQGLYVYSAPNGFLSGLPPTEPEFVEVVCRMLEQSGDLDRAEIKAVRDALAHRFRWDGHAANGGTDA